jgi:MFS family permease
MPSVIEERPLVAGPEIDTLPTLDDGLVPGQPPPPADRPRRWPRWRPTGLWRHPDFLRLWSAESISQLGSQVTLLALPLLAAITLDATPFQVGLLAALGWTPWLLFGLVAGVWVDRLPRRPLMIAADLGRAAVLATVPLAALLGLLRMEVLYTVAFLTGALTVVFDVAYLAYLPTLVARDDLVEGNSKLETSASAAQIVGPGIAGLLVRLIGAPGAILVDALSFAGSALLIGRIRVPEPARPAAGATASDPASERRHVLREIGEGMGAVARQPILRALAAASATTNLAGYLFLSIYVLYMTDELHLSPAAVGLVFATGGVGALVGTVAAGPARARFGVGRTILGAQVLFGVTGLLVPLAVLVPAIALPLVVAAEFLQWLMVLVYDVNAVSLRQAITPDRVMGRVNATMRFLVWGMRPFGALLGGLLGGLIGLPLTLVVGELGMFVAFAWLLASPLPRLRAVPSGEARD